MSALQKGTNYKLQMTKRAGFLEKISAFSAPFVVKLTFFQ